MSNLKGSTYIKQQRDMRFRLFALGTKKQGDSLSHSSAILTKRDIFFKDFANYLQQQGIEGKLNLLLTENNLNNFLQERLANLSLRSTETYLSGFNSMLNAFKEVGITVGVSENYFNDKWHSIKENSPQINNHSSRGLNSATVIEELKNIRYESAVIANLMLSHGYRISEAMRIVNSPSHYITRLSNGQNIISGVKGKGGKVYQKKLISHRDMKMIENMRNIPSKSTFHKDLKKIDSNLRAHDFRYQYARNLFNKVIVKSGYDKALKVVSKALNHNRSSISLTYI